MCKNLFPNILILLFILTKTVSYDHGFEKSVGPMLLCWLSHVCSRACIWWIHRKSKGTCCKTSCWWSIQGGCWTRPSGKISNINFLINTTAREFYCCCFLATSVILDPIPSQIPILFLHMLVVIYNFQDLNRKKKSKCQKFGIHFWCYSYLTAFKCWRTKIFTLATHY